MDHREADQFLSMENSPKLKAQTKEMVSCLCEYHQDIYMLDLTLHHDNKE